MEISDIKRRIVDTIERAKRQAAERRVRTDEITREYAAFLDRTAIPVLRQIANVLRSEGYPFTVFTPGGSVRLMSDRATEDYVEILLDAGGAGNAGNDDAVVSGHRSRGRRVVETEQPLGPPAALTEEDILSFVLKAIEPLVER
jgi:hypothetical protein